MNDGPRDGAPAQLTTATLIADYERDCGANDQTELIAQAKLIAALTTASPDRSLECAQQLVLRRRLPAATAVLAAARTRDPDSIDVAFALAGLERESGRDAEAETTLRSILRVKPAHAAAALMLARMLGAQGRARAAVEALRETFVGYRHPIDITIRAMELLDELDRKADASAIAEAEIAAGNADPRVHAYAATYAIQLGEFRRARTRYEYAYAHSDDAPEWNVPFGLASAQRYQDRDHPDFTLFRACLARPDLSEKARISLLFALGKALDDVADFAEAARFFRQANDMIRQRWPLSRKQWRRGIAARIAARPLSVRREAGNDFVPVFIVGVPRSGTTLTAELLSRHSLVKNRGELRWIWKLAQRIPTAGVPDRALLDAFAHEYEMHLKQDDSGDARWLIDKQPLNLLHVDLILALWPQAKFIHCQRNRRDNALSLWVQSFYDDSYALASDFADIAAFQQGCEKIMAHWRTLYAPAIHEIRYEDLARDPAAVITEVTHWLGLPDATPGDEIAPARVDAISTASLWQARQPVYTRSVGRWRNYSEHVPELAQISDR